MSDGERNDDTVRDTTARDADVWELDDDEGQARRLARALARLEGYRRNRALYGGLGAADMRLLWLVVDAGPQTLAEITRALGLERSTVNRQVNAAVDAGLLAKGRVAGSSAHRVELTDDGRAAFEHAACQALTAITETLAGMSGGEADELVALMERFVDAYGRRVGAVPSPE
ncbi:MAG: MarR family transcriptional regulator [Gordonia sp. (in: high G+C Gram-positive bacteria)]|uniref:MarR family winged helix-turn-helix transcriptional regulator n=1 Tax=Gordonia sp. (in: high G+C Gram-positive bacteria) TaxID=84139 RepID=UPI0039E60FE1